MRMMERMLSRREELIAGASTGDLSDEEWREFDQARTADPSMDAELAELWDTAARLDAADVTWREEAPPSGLLERILAATSEPELRHDHEDGQAATP